MKRSIFIGLLLIATFGSLVYAQLVPTSYPSQPVYRNLLVTNNSGYISTDYGDFTGDGIDDIAYTFASTLARIDIYEGKTGNLINSFNINSNLSSQMEPYDLIAINDINNDGIDEIVIVGNPCPFSSCDRIYFYDGSNGNLLNVIQSSYSGGTLGPFAELGGDINGDGLDDFLVVDFNSSFSNPQIRIYNANYSQISTVRLPSGVSLMPISISGIGDVNRNGVKDFIVGFPGILTTAGSGKAYVYDGANLNIIYALNATPTGYLLGQHVLGRAKGKIFDYNRDGVSDFVVSEGGLGGVNNAKMFSGATGNQIGPVVQGTFSTSFDGAELSADVNGDGYSEFLSEGPSTNGTVLNLYSGPNGSILHQWNYPAYSPNNVLSSDLTGDGLGEVNLINFQNGNKYLITEKLGGILSYGSNTLTAIWSYSAGTHSKGRIAIGGMNPGQQFCIGLSNAPSNIPLPSGDTILIDINNPNFILDCNSSYRADNSGNYAIRKVDIQNSGLAGQKLYVQIAIDRAGSIFTSNGLEITFVP